MNANAAKTIASYSNKDNDGGFPIELFPLEILYLIIEKLDDDSFANCFNVSRKWRSVTIRIANADKTNQRWESICDVYNYDKTFKVKSCGLPYGELFANLLCWNLSFSFSFFGSCLVKDVKTIHIYRDNIIVVDYDGVKYFDVHTHNMKKNLQIKDCFDFNERDEFVYKGTQVQINQVSDCKLFLYGKKDMHDNSYETAVQRDMRFGNPGMNHDHAVTIGGVGNFAIERCCCYVMNAHSNALVCYIWLKSRWEVRNLGRFYGNRDDTIYAMNVLNAEVFMLVKWGKMLKYAREKLNFSEVSRVSMPANKTVLVRMVHKCCLVIGVPDFCDFRITRLRTSEGYNFYKFECPNLSCVNTHGDMLLLGFTDGKIEIFMPRSNSREDMFKRRIYISEFTSEPTEPEDLVVISVDVFEDFGQHYLFIATHSAIYQLLVKHDEDVCIWDRIPERPRACKFPIPTISAM